MKKKIRNNGIAQHLKVLKMKLVTEENFQEIYTYFFDHLAEDDAFMRMGKPKRNARLEKVLVVAAQEALNTETVVIQRQLFLNLRKHHFTHGPAQMNEYLTNVIYFNDIDVGLLTLTPFPGVIKDTKTVRFSMREMDGMVKPSLN
ncbi:MAG: hypothetical protein GWP17_02180 [Aquificales bacterium]|nr:hypothetical protein [Aquificales bacterium]